MKNVETFKKFNHKVSRAIEWVGLAALVLMMVITTVTNITASMTQMMGKGYRRLIPAPKRNQTPVEKEMRIINLSPFELSQLR